MDSTGTVKHRVVQEKLNVPFSKSLVGSLFKALIVSGLLLYWISIFLCNNPKRPAGELSTPFPLPWPSSASKPSIRDSPTNVSHLMFGIVGSLNAYKNRKAYIESWWRPNVTRGYLYLDVAPTNEYLPWPSSSPPFRVSDDNTKLLEETKHVAPISVRIAHTIFEVFREEHQDMRWLVIGDDDSIFFVDNWIHVLSKYDHAEYIYIGGNAEDIMSNYWYSFNMGFGGGGFALSYPLVEAMVKSLDDCFRRYPYLRFADLIIMTCIADLGVTLTANKGIHQIDLHKDISGLLSAHPPTPVLSLHHFDMVEPIFPSMDRFESANHLHKAANLDQSRLFQQTICYHKQSSWSFSISWGYSAHIYEKLIPRSILRRPIETFIPWGGRDGLANYVFDTRPVTNDSCEAPHVFFFESIQRMPGDKEIVSWYKRASQRGLPACPWPGNHSADHISRIEVFSPATKLVENGRSECCDIVDMDSMSVVASVKLRPCIKDEVIA